MVMVNRLWIVLAVLFACSQTAMIHHDAEHSEHSHDHDCEYCEALTISKDELLEPLPTKIYSRSVKEITTTRVGTLGLSEVLWPYERASRGRGPPTNSN